MRARILLENSPKHFPFRPGAGSLGGEATSRRRPSRSEAPEGESAVAHREEGRGPPPDRSDQRRNASFLFWRALEPSRPPACSVARRTERPPLGVCLLSRARLRRGAAKMTVSRTSKMLNYINFREFRWPREPPSLHPPHTHTHLASSTDPPLCPSSLTLLAPVPTTTTTTTNDQG